MNKLDEIEARYSNEGIIETIQIADDLGLLVRAVRQLGESYMSWYSSRPDLAVERLDPDILKLIEKAE